MARSEAPDVVVAGHICLDIIPDLAAMALGSPAAFFRPGALVITGAAAVSTGGPVSNTGLALVRMGVATALMGKVGTDPLGRLIAELLRERWGIREGLIAAEGATTSYTVPICPPGYDRMFLHCPGANDDFAAGDIDYDLVARARVFHLGYPPVMRRMYADGGRELIEVFRRVKGLGVTTSLDMTLPDPASPGGRADWRAILAALMPLVDVFVPSAEEALYMLARERFDALAAAGDIIDRLTGDDVHALGERMLAMGGRIVGVKTAHRGAYLRTGPADALASAGRAAPADPDAWANRELWRPAYAIEGPPNATGSGDSAYAGFLAALLRGLGPADALACANAAGADNVMAPDALSGIRPWEELRAAIDAGWAAQPLEVAADAWRRGADGVWHGPAEAG